MRICFITSEIFIGKRRGGFGKLVRIIGRELVKRGFEVSVICWREVGEDPVMELDGMEVLSYPYDFTTRSSLKHVMDYTMAVPLIRRADADVYISIDCMVETYIAQRVMPNRKHVIWVQDPFDWRDHELLGSIDPCHRVGRLKFLVTTKLYGLAYKRADLILTQAKHYIPKVARLYNVNPRRILYLPNPVEHIPDEGLIIKSKTPMVCFLGRMDPQKRYWLFFELAKSFPDFQFIAIGAPNLLHEELYKRLLTKYKYESIQNLRILGFVDEETKFKILSESWLMLLPSIREGLPLAFLEALSHKCALLSSVNPDGIVDAFGFWAKNDNFREGLLLLIENETWRLKGELGYNYVCKNHHLDIVVGRLISFLENVT